MRDVRRRERLAGLKRVPRRENRQKPEPTVISTHFKTDADPSKDNLEQETTSLCSLSSSSRVAEPIGNALNGEQRLRRPSTFMAGHSPSSRFSPSPWLFPISWLLDPFNTLPGASQAPSMIGHLISYCKLPGYLQGCLLFAASHRIVSRARFVSFHPFSDLIILKGPGLWFPGH